jgi:hypothetical protein
VVSISEVTFLIWALRTTEVHIAIICACILAGKPFLRKYMPRVIGSSYRSRTATTRLHTIRSTHGERLSSREVGDGPQDTIFTEDTISELRRHLTTYRLANNCDVERNPTATVELGTEPPVREEYGSDRGLIIMGGRETAGGGS